LEEDARGYWQDSEEEAVRQDGAERPQELGMRRRRRKRWKRKVEEEEKQRRREDPD